MALPQQLSCLDEDGTQYVLSLPAGWLSHMSEIMSQH